MKTVLNTAPTIEPITPEEVMIHCAIDDETGYWNDFITRAIKGARRKIEGVTRRALLTQTWDYYLDCFPSDDAFKLPFGNLQSVTHIKYTDSDGDQTTMTVTTEYIVETNGDQCGRIVLPYGESWPSFTAYTSNPIVIRFVCGWTTAALVPEEIKIACLLSAGEIFTNRESQYIGMPGQKYEINPSYMNLLNDYRLWEEF